MSEFQQDRETCERAVARPWEELGVDAAAEFIKRGLVRWPIALSRIAALEAERDAAFKRGWDACKAKAVEAVRNVERAMDDPPSQWLLDAEDAIRAIAPEVKP